MAELDEATKVFLREEVRNAIRSELRNVIRTVIKRLIRTLIRSEIRSLVRSELRASGRRKRGQGDESSGTESSDEEYEEGLDCGSEVQRNKAPAQLKVEDGGEVPADLWGGYDDCDMPKQRGIKRKRRQGRGNISFEEAAWEAGDDKHADQSEPHQIRSGKHEEDDPEWTPAMITMAGGEGDGGEEVDVSESWPTQAAAIPDPDQDLPIEFLTTNRNRQLLSRGGYVFRFEKKSASDPSKEFWKCEEVGEKRKRCKCRLHLRDGKVVAFFHDHSHSPEEAQVMKRRVQHRIRNDAVTTPKCVSDIVASHMQTLPEEVAFAMPSDGALSRMITRIRKKVKSERAGSIPTAHFPSNSETLILDDDGNNGPVAVVLS